MKKIIIISLIIFCFGKIKSAEIEKTQIWLHRAQEKFNNFENGIDFFKSSKINGLEIDVYYEKNTKRG